MRRPTFVVAVAIIAAATVVVVVVVIVVVVVDKNDGQSARRSQTSNKQELTSTIQEAKRQTASLAKNFFACRIGDRKNDDAAVGGDGELIVANEHRRLARLPL